MAEEKKNLRGANLTQAHRERGGKVSAAKQKRDARGKFSGSTDKHVRDKRELASTNKQDR